MAQSTDEVSAPPRLRRDLGIVAVVGISLATMAPSMAININPQGMVPSVGPAVPVAFILATVGILLVAYTFARLAQRFDHAGSLYGQVGATLGPRAGVIAGWLLIGTYAAFGVVTSIAAGRFAASLAQSLGLWASPPDVVEYAIAIVLVVGSAVIASGKAKRSTGILVVVEAATVALILLVSVVVFHRLATGQSPTGLTVDWSVFQVQAGTTPSALFTGVTFGILSFAGFEAAATLGEEATKPRRDIPRALIAVPVIAGVFFVVVSAVEVMGFGATANGLQEFQNSESLMGDLAASYLSPWVGDVITVGALCSAISCTLACIVATSRLLYAFGRDGLLPGRLDELTPDDGVPARAVFFVTGLIVVAELIAGLVLRTDTLTLFIQAGETGVLLILLAYLLATVGMARLVFFQGDRRVARWQVVIPGVALVMLTLTWLSNIWPFPTGADLWAPCLAAAWVLLGAVVVARMKGTPPTVLADEEESSMSA